MGDLGGNLYFTVIAFWMLNYLTDPDLKDAAFAFFTSLGREHIRLIEHEAQSVDFQTKLILIEVLKHLESA